MSPLNCPVNVAGYDVKAGINNGWATLDHSGHAVQLLHDVYKWYDLLVKAGSYPVEKE